MMQADLCPPAEERRVLEVKLERGQPVQAPGYGSLLATTSLGPPSLQRWCVWVEPAATSVPDRWEQRWLGGVRAAIKTWSAELPLVQVTSPEQAHVVIKRRRPPRRRLAGGWRASNGRSQLQVVEVRRIGRWRLEPQVTVMVSPELRASVLQSTALHELGHAFGLWGHSPEAADVLAVHQGQSPVLELTQRDRATLNWMRKRETRFGQALNTSDSTN